VYTIQFCGRLERAVGQQKCGRSVVHEDTSTITFSEVITTKMACDDDRMRLERAVLGTLRGSVAYRIDADVLRLDGSDGHGLRLRATAG